MQVSIEVATPRNDTDLMYWVMWIPNYIYAIIDLVRGKPWEE